MSSWRSHIFEISWVQLPCDNMFPSSGSYNLSISSSSISPVLHSGWVVGINIILNTYYTINFIEWHVHLILLLTVAVHPEVMLHFMNWQSTFYWSVLVCQDTFFSLGILQWWLLRMMEKIPFCFYRSSSKSLGFPLLNLIYRYSFVMTTLNLTKVFFLVSSLLW